MARWRSSVGVPDAIERREILAGHAKHAELDLDAIGESYVASGWLSDAVDFFERAGNMGRLEELRARAIEEDVFLLLRLEKVAGLAITPDDWRRAGEAALASGRDRSAATAFEHAGETERAAESRARADAFRAELPPPKKGRGGLELS